MANVDYWRICSFSDQDYYLFSSWVSRFGAGKAHRFLQYQGTQRLDTPLFIGKGEQVSKYGDILRHYLCQHSGSDSHKTFSDALSRSTVSIYCTRLDIQRTIRHEWTQEEWRNIADGLPGKKSLVQSETSTIYVGTRTSDNFARLYQKPGGFVRLEFETKGLWSRRFFSKGIDINSVYAFLLTRCPLPEPVKALFSLRSDENDKYIKESLERDKERKLAWLQSILPAIDRMANDDDIGDRTCALLESSYSAILEARENREKRGYAA